MDLNDKEKGLLIDLSNKKFKKEPNMTELSESLGIRQDHKSFIQIRKWLENKKIISITSERGNKIVQINYKKLDENIPEIPYNRKYELQFRKRFPRGFEY